MVVPNSRPVFAAVGTIVFIGAWNAFLWPLVIGQSRDAWTVQVALSTFTTAQVVNIHELFTAAAVSIVPLLVVFLLLQRYIVAGGGTLGHRRLTAPARDPAGGSGGQPPGDRYIVAGVERSGIDD
ncbi:hypothetical protein GCM10020000_56080 [Streptomyces olivoverticillatus]